MTNMKRKISIQEDMVTGTGKTIYRYQAVNSGSVMPVIFTTPILTILPLLVAVTVLPSFFGNFLNPGWPHYYLLYAIAIVLFCFFYNRILFNQRAEDKDKIYGRSIPGIHPNLNADVSVNNIVGRFTAISALLLILICLLPEFILTGFKFHLIPWIGHILDNFLDAHNLNWIPMGLGFPDYFWFPKVIIVIGIAIDIIRRIELQLRRDGTK